MTDVDRQATLEEDARYPPGSTKETALTMTRPPRSAQAGPGSGATGGGRDPGGLRIAGFSIRLTAGGYLLALLVVLAAAMGLPAISPGWPVLAYFGVTAGLVAGFLASLIVHELAHAVTARRYGSPGGQIVIGFARSTGHSQEEYATARALGRVALAGPAASLATAAIFAAAAVAVSAGGAGYLVFILFAALAWANGLLTIVSALPGPGLDGGRAVRALAWARSGDRARGTVTAARIGQYTGALLIAGGVALLALGYLAGIPAGLVGLLMVGASRAQARQVLAVTAMADLRVSDVLPQGGPVISVPGWQTVQAFLDETMAGGTAAAPAGGSQAQGREGSAPAGQPGPAAGTAWAGGQAAGGAVAFGVRDFDGRPAGLLTLSQLMLVPPDRRDTLRVSGIATPLDQVVTTTTDEPLSGLLSRLSTVRPHTPAALHTAGHALVIGADGGPAGVLTPADFARASQLAALHGKRRPNR
jgi:Zn-dependent protease